MAGGGWAAFLVDGFSLTETRVSRIRRDVLVITYFFSCSGLMLCLFLLYLVTTGKIWFENGDDPLVIGLLLALIAMVVLIAVFHHILARYITCKLLAEIHRRNTNPS